MEKQNGTLLLIKIGLILVIGFLVVLSQAIEIPYQLALFLGAAAIWYIWDYKPKKKDKDNKTLN